MWTCQIVSIEDHGVFMDKLFMLTGFEKYLGLMLFRQAGFD